MGRTAKYYVGSASAFGEWEGVFYNYEASSKSDAFRRARQDAAWRCDARCHNRGEFVLRSVNIRYKGRVIAKWVNGKRQGTRTT